MINNVLAEGEREGGREREREMYAVAMTLERSVSLCMECFHIETSWLTVKFIHMGNIFIMRCKVSLFVT